VTAVEVTLAPDALEDLIDIGDHLSSRAGAATALAWVERLTRRARSLSDPMLHGAENPQLGGGRRTHPERPYVLVYTVRPAGDVLVLRIVHGARDLPALFSEE